MILSDQNILSQIQEGKIVIKPIPSLEQIQPSSIDLTLSNEYLKPINTEEALDTKNSQPKYQPIKSNAIIIPPNEFILASTKEWVEIPNDLVAKVEGRSSIGRLGLLVHISAGFVDSGFKGKITLEIKNLSNQSIILYEGMRICQIIFEQLSGTPSRIYGECGNKYQGQDTVTGSLLYFDEDNIPNGSIH